MTSTSFVADLMAVSAQITAVVAVAAVVALLIRIDLASVRYQYWRALFILCLVLPWVQTRQSSAPIVRSVVPPAAIGPMTATPVASSGVAAGPTIPWTDVAVGIVLAGIVIRIGLVGVGLLRLRRLRRSGRLAPESVEHDELQWALGTRAEIRYVVDGQPVTCGIRRPVVLLPESLTAHPPDIQRAVLVHELLHVQRRDWMWVMGEELASSVLWFHPAVWWVVRRVRLTREEVVDELTVLATGQRRAYLEALLAFADAAPVVASAAFARRAHLFHRMMLISKEAVMSSKRVVFSCAVLAVAVMAGSWYAVDAFPMMQAPGVVQPSAQTQNANEPGPLERAAKPITPENPIPRRTYSVTPPNPGGPDSGVLMIALRLTLDAQGRVAEVRSISGTVGGRGRDAAVITGRGVTGRATTVPAPGSSPFVNVKPVIDAVRQWIYEPPVDAPISFDVIFQFAPGSEARLLAHGGPMLGGRTSAPPPPPPPPAPGTGTALAWAPGAVRVGGAIMAPKKVKDVPPLYPPIAESARVQGVVILETLIGTDGHVQDARVLRSVPLLDQAAVDAVKEWEFTPTLLNGQPVPVIMTVTVQFTLN